MKAERKTVVFMEDMMGGRNGKYDNITKKREWTVMGLENEGGRIVKEGMEGEKKRRQSEGFAIRPVKIKGE